MYGFIESRLARLLDIEYDPYICVGGAEAALIGRAHFERAFRAIHAMWIDDGDDGAIEPQIISADVAGTKIILHKYYYSDDVLDSLTSGSTKNGDAYLAIKNIGTGAQRFDIDDFEEVIVGFYDASPMGETQRERPTVRVETVVTTPPPTVQRPEPEIEVTSSPVVTLDKTSTEIAIEKSFRDMGAINFATRGLFKVAYLPGLVSGLEGNVFEMADILKKHIVIGHDTARIRIAKQNIAKEAINSFLIIVTNPELAGVDLFRTQMESSTVVFGKEVDSLYVVKGANINEDIDRARNDTSLIPSARDNKIQEIIREGRNSPYAKYDKIYKDTVTNVVFAVQSKNVITLTFNPGYSESNRAFLPIALREILRRFDGTASYEELALIDMEYQKSFESSNADEYAKFLTESSTAILKQLKKAFEEAKKAYEDQLNKAMESGKMCSKYMDQIEAFNEEGQNVKIRKKALEEYSAVKGIEKVRTIYVADNAVNVYTDNLFVIDERDGKIRDVGTFHIQIGMHSNTYDTENTVRIRNTKHQIIGFGSNCMQAPHVFQDGHICHGTLAPGMTNAYKKRDLFQLVYQLILFLQQANTGDPAGKYVDKWPEVSKEYVEQCNRKVSVKAIASAVPVISEEDKQFNEAFAQAIPV